MIGVAGQYQLTLNLEGRGDFLREENLDHFTLIEEVGGDLPTFELVFQSTDATLISHLNEGSAFDCRITDPQGNSTICKLAVVTAVTNRMGAAGYRHMVRGTSNHTGYNLNQRVRLTEKMSSVDAIKLAASPYFDVTGIEAQSNDQQTWIQHNISDRRFIYDCWMHCDLADSFPLLAITANGQLRLRDAAKVARAAPKATLGIGTNYPIDPEMQVTNSSSFLNSQGAYGLEQVESVVAQHRSFDEIKITQPVSSLLTGNPSLNRAKQTPTRRIPPVFRSENMHPNYWEAWRRNLASLTAYSSTQIAMSVRNRIVPVNAADLVMFKDDEQGSRAVESYSGLYFVSKVSITIARRNLVTGLILEREALNSSRGDFR